MAFFEMGAIRVLALGKERSGTSYDVQHLSFSVITATVT
jgi:hypothetical protein